MRAYEENGIFSPGHVQIERGPLCGNPGYQLSLDYAVRQDDSGVWVDFVLGGEIGAQRVREGFSLHRDFAYNFLQNVGRCLRKYGLIPRLAPLFLFHGDYDRVFADLRAQLHAHAGEPVDLQRFLQGEGLAAGDKQLFAAVGLRTEPAHPGL
ncbi:MAG: DUF5064 family protein [Pseudomonas sp.]|uniref:DUF5064 family protein n=1 Tax=Pseudomonas sp. TaxID=306 RepID=UPI00339B0C7B